MVEQEGEVLEIQGQYALISPRSGNACGTCAPAQGCGVANLARLFGARQPGVRVLNTLGARVGDRVIVSLPDDALLKTSLVVYGLPLAAMLVFAVVTDVVLRWAAVLNSDPWLILASGVGFFGSVIFVRFCSRRMSLSGRFQPTVSRIAGRA
jgi:sigma-E factor negative regulatory protein RseC